jgi:tetratricopeptide (TPR) repeat protein
MRKICLLVWLGMVPVWAGEMPEKAADYHAALVNRPESAQLFERFRDAWLEERSVADLEKELLSRAEAKEAGAWATLARAYLAAGRSEQALEAFGMARKQAPSAWLSLEMARLRLAAKDFSAAEKDALAVPEGDPQRAEALKLAGLACLRAERIDDALAHWTKAVAAAPGDSGLLEDLTELTRREGRFDLALDYCGKWRDATSDAYGKAMATLRRADLLLGSQRFDEAMIEFAAVLEVSADDSWIERETLARAEQAHRQRGNTTGWAKWIGEKADAHPARLNFRRTQSQALAAAGKTDEALEVLTEVMRRSPGDTSVRWLRVGLLEQSMKLAQAYDECAELAAKEKSETAGLRLAELAFRLEKKDELKRALDDVLAAADPARRVGLAGLYARYGLPESAERIWREEAAGEQGGQALRFLAKHLKTAGREKEAAETWKQLGARDVAQDRIDRHKCSRWPASAARRGRS